MVVEECWRRSGGGLVAWWIGSEALRAKGVRGGVPVSHSHVALNW